MLLIATVLYALIGGPSVGKTSIIEELKKEGEHTVREVATDLILERIAQGAEEPWNKENFQLDVTMEHLEREKAALAKKEYERVFVDRGILDSYIYLDLRGRLKTNEYEKVQALISKESIKDRYAIVFYIEPHSGVNFCSKEEDYRAEATEEALKICKLTIQTYEKYFNLVHVPANLTPKERARFILDYIQKVNVEKCLGELSA